MDLRPGRKGVHVTFIDIKHDAQAVGVNHADDRLVDVHRLAHLHEPLDDRTVEWRTDGVILQSRPSGVFLGIGLARLGANGLDLGAGDNAVFAQRLGFGQESLQLGEFCFRPPIVARGNFVIEKDERITGLGRRAGFHFHLGNTAGDLCRDIGHQPWINRRRIAALPFHGARFDREDEILPLLELRLLLLQTAFLFDRIEIPSHRGQHDSHHDGEPEEREDGALGSAGEHAEVYIAGRPASRVSHPDARRTRSPPAC